MHGVIPSQIQNLIFPFIVLPDAPASPFPQPLGSLWMVVLHSYSSPVPQISAIHTPSIGVLFYLLMKISGSVMNINKTYRWIVLVLVSHPEGWHSPESTSWACIHSGILPIFQLHYSPRTQFILPPFGYKNTMGDNNEGLVETKWHLLHSPHLQR